MRRRALSVAALVGLALVPAATAAAAAAAQGPAPAAAVGPARTAWFDRSTQAPGPVRPQGTGASPEDLVVAGVTVASAATPGDPTGGGVSRTEPTAITALLFTLPQTSSAATLTLRLASGPSTASGGNQLPVAAAPVACPATTAWKPGGGQPWAALPSYDCSGRTSTGSLSSDGASVQFSDIGIVAHGQTLSLVVVPGTVGADRLVFAKPSADALSLLTLDASPPAGGAGPPGAPVPATSSGPTTASTSAGPALPAPADAGTPGSADRAPRTAAAPAPAVASPSPTRSALGLPVVSPPDPRTRLILLAGLLALVAATAVLVATDPSTQGLPLRQLVRAAPPDKEWGVGRHRSVRSGPTPSI